MAQLDLPVEKHRLLSRVAAALVALAVFALYSLFSWFQWRHFIVPSWDLGIFAQLAKAYAHFETPIVPIKGEGFNLLGDHFHPITVLLTPFYMLWPSPATLLYVQNGLVAVSVYLLVRFAQRVLSQVAALCLGLAYAVSFGVQQAVAVQFHEVAFALPFLVLSLGYLVLSKLAGNPAAALRRGVYWALPLVFVKEDMGVTVLAIGLVATWRTGWFKSALDLSFPRQGSNPPPAGGRLRALGRSWLVAPAVAESSLLMLWGAAWSLLSVGFILPLFNTGGVFDYSDKLDVAAALGNPLGAFAQLFYPWEKSVTLGLLLLTGVLTWVISPLALVAAPTLIWRFLSSQEGYWAHTWHYSLVLMPVVFMALLDVLARANRKGRSRPVGRFAHARATTCTLAVQLLPPLTLAIALLMSPYQPLTQLADRSFATPQLSPADKAKQSAVASIPRGATVASDLSILTYLVEPTTVYWIGHEGKPAPDYVVIDHLGSAWGGNPPADVAAYAAERYRATYTNYRSFGSITIAKKAG